MKFLTPIIFSISFAVAPVFANETIASKETIIKEAAEISLSDFLWTHRPIIVLADSPDDPRFIKQMSLLRADSSELAEQDVIILTDTNPSLKSALREQLRPRGFMLVLIGKDGGVKLRKPFPWNVREISRVIDKMPMRRQEINDGG
jgi:hypothetical protein